LILLKNIKFAPWSDGVKYWCFLQYLSILAFVCMAVAIILGLINHKTYLFITATLFLTLAFPRPAGLVYIFLSSLYGMYLSSIPIIKLVKIAGIANDLRSAIIKISGVIFFSLMGYKKNLLLITLLSCTICYFWKRKKYFSFTLKNMVRIKELMLYVLAIILIASPFIEEHLNYNWNYKTVSKKAEFANHAQLQVIITSDYYVTNLSVNPVSNQIASAGYKKYINLWHMYDRKQSKLEINARYRGTPNSLTYSPDGRYLAYSLSAQSLNEPLVYVLNAENGNVLASIEQLGQVQQNSIAFSPDSNYIAIAHMIDKQQYITIFDVKHAEISKRAAIKKKIMSPLFYNKSADHIYYLSYKAVVLDANNNIKKIKEELSLMKLNIESNTEVEIINQIPAHAKSVVMDKDDESLIVAYRDKILIYDIQMRKLSKSIEDSSGGIEVVAIIPDSKYLIASGRDKRAVFWDTETGNFISSLPGDSKALQLVFSRDGSNLVSAHGKQICIWKLSQNIKEGNK